jgi:hypothetical protein
MRRKGRLPPGHMIVVDTLAREVEFRKVTAQAEKMFKEYVKEVEA